MRIKTLIFIVITLLLASYFMCERLQTKRDTISATQLTTDDKEKILIDPVAHTLTVINHNGTNTGYLPERTSIVDVKKDGRVIVTARQSGLEHSLFVGGGFAPDGLRFTIGIDAWYFKKLDLGVFVSDLTKDLTKPCIGVQLSYNMWHDVRFSVGIDSAGSPNLFLTERI